MTPLDLLLAAARRLPLEMRSQRIAPQTAIPAPFPKWLIPSHSFPAPRRKKRGQRQAFLSPHLRLIILVILTVVPGLLVTPTHSPALAASPVSPLVWGTNLSLYNMQDFFLTNQTTITLTQQMHVQMIRFPYRGDLAVTEAAARQIAAIRAIPLLILPYGVEQVATDQALVQLMNRVFGNQTVYYEYGNERDLPVSVGISAEAYTASWNTVIAQVKPLTYAGRFVGPVLSHVDAAFLEIFLKQANPRPDAVSWHEYTCGTKDPDSTCLQAISAWGNHIQQARNAMQQAIGTTLPIMLTEYNWNANAQNDPRATNSTFLEAWMNTAIAELIRDDVFAANQYVLTNNDQLAMIADTTHTLTAVGTIFQSTFEQAQARMQSPSAAMTSLVTHTGCMFLWSCRRTHAEYSTQAPPPRIRQYCARPGPCCFRGPGRTASERLSSRSVDYQHRFYQQEHLSFYLVVRIVYSFPNH